MDQQKKFYVALSIYAVLGLLIWVTIDNIPLPVMAFMPASRVMREFMRNFGPVTVTLRQLALAILALFVLRTVLHRYAMRIRKECESEQS